jgi:hypothetical protein
MKSYASDFLPQEKGKYHMFAKYDFQVNEASDLHLHLKVDIPTDKYLLNYMRLKILDKSQTSRKYLTQTEG